MRLPFALPLFSAVLAASPAVAETGEAAFEGFYAGPEAGLYDQHFFLETTSATGARTGRYYRNWTYAGGLFAGYDIPVGEKLRLGGEVGATIGGGTNIANLGTGTLSYRSRYGYRLVVRGGVIVAPRLMLYANGGYGGNRYRIRNSAGVIGAHEWGSSFIVGAGAEYRLSRAMSLRIDVKHVDNESSQFFIGLPVRF